MVSIYSYSSAFARKFKKEKTRLLGILGGQVSIEHFGSTAVSGLAGKGVIDIIVGFDSREDLQQAIPILETSGYTLDRTVRKGRVFLSSAGRRESGWGDIHLHLALKNSPVFKDALIFRDYLRTNEVLQKQYNSLKEKLVKQVKNDRQLYTKLKSSFIKKILKQAKN